MSTDPFAGITDEQPADGASTREALLGDAKRGYCP